MFKHFLLVSVAILTTQTSQRCLAQGRMEQSGTIDIVDTEQKAKDPYKDNQELAIRYFRELDQKLQQLAGGSNVVINPVPLDTANYLSGVYLYCTVHSGKCPLVLDAILEAEIAASVISKSAQCPGMKAFWKAWITNQFEERLKYMMKTGFINTTADFNSNERPKYIKCEETIKKEISSANNPASYFKSRYSENSPYRRTAQKMAAFLELLKTKVPNVFVATGAKKIN